MAIKSNSVFWGEFWHILKKLLEISASELSIRSKVFQFFGQNNLHITGAKVSRELW